MKNQYISQRNGYTMFCRTSGIRFVITAMAALLSFSSCSRDTGPSVAVIPKGTTHVFWKSVHAGAEKAAKENNVRIFWQGPQKEDDRSLQIGVVENFISRGVDAIVLAPLDAVALVRPVEAAIQKKIPVVIIDSDLQSKKTTSFVATDNFKGGKLAAQRLADILGERKNILMMRYAEGSASTTKREEGFLEGIREFVPDAMVLSSDQYGGVTAESAMQTGQNLLNKFSEIDGIFTPNESTTFGMLRSLRTAGKAGQIRFIGFDASEPLLSALQNGVIDGLVVQNPFAIGYLGVSTACKALQGEPVKERIDTGVMMVTAENLNAEDIQALLNPPVEEEEAEK